MPPNSATLSKNQNYGYNNQYANQTSTMRCSFVVF